MKNTNKAFTLVELIVVITILAILGTIAFISLQGYSQDAKNSKVASDLGTLASAIEISNTKGDTTIAGLLDEAKNTTVELSDGTAGSGVIDMSSANAGTCTNNTCGIGGVNFASLNQNGADFKDSNDPARDYVYAYAASGSIAYYQIAGQIKEASGTDKVYVKGNYVKQAPDALGLIKGTATASGIVNNSAEGIFNY